MDLQIFLSQLVDGIGYGCIYGLFGLSIVILYRANKLFNFGLTEICTICLIFLMYFTQKFGVLIGYLLAVVVSFFIGYLIHVLFIRIVTERKAVLRSSESILTVGIYIIFNSLSSYVIGDEPRPFPSPFGEGSFTFHEASIPRHTLGICFVASILVLCIFIFFKFSDLGKKFEAVAENSMLARLRGIRSSNILASAWGISISLGLVATIFIAPLLYVTPSMLTSIYGYSLMAVALGGLESPLGALIGGLLIGLVENISSNIPFIGSELKFLAVVVLLLVILAFRPRGFFGRLEARKI